MLEILTAGESHGKALIAVLSGFPAGIGISTENINTELQRRQEGYGRGGRMKIEHDKAEILSGVRGGVTTGAPLALIIYNLDFENWKEIMDTVNKSAAKPLLSPRPGHADLPGSIKYALDDIRDVLERASARGTASRVAAGAVAKMMLGEFGIKIFSRVIAIGGIKTPKENLEIKLYDVIENSKVRCDNKITEKKWIETIDQASADKDTLGGEFEVVAVNVPPGLGTYAVPEEKLDALLAASTMSIPAIKSVSIGEGSLSGSRKGSQAHDEIYYKKETGYLRSTNRAGGIEGGISNGERIVVKAVMKPIPTLMKPLKTVNIETKQAEKALTERADVCAVPSAAVIGEAETAIVLAREFLKKFGSDNLKDIHASYNAYLKRIQWKRQEKI